MSQEPPKSANWTWTIIAIVGVVGLLILLTDRFPDTLNGSNNVGRLLYLLGCLALVGGGFISFVQQRPMLALRNAMIWLGLLIVLATSYGFLGQLSYFAERFGPPTTANQGVVTGTGEISFKAGPDGHFHVEAMVDGRPVLFLVDTGASDIVLSPADARRLGFDLAKLSFNQQAETANGMVRGASIQLFKFEVGPIVIENIGATVNEAEMSESLLGISYLSRLSGYQVSGDTLTLRR
ncbi:MAG: retropepsin-like aspartic protease family protein [Dongiaceae bacterium]